MIITNVTLRFPSEVILQELTCEESEVGIDTVVLVDNDDCDSVVITVTSLRTNLDTTILIFLPYGGSVTLPNGQVVSDTGVYIVELITADGCDSTITVLVQFDPNESLIKLPDTFTPNNDGFNDILFAYTTFQLEFFTMSVFDSWGENVFNSTSIEVGWDGSFKGQPMNGGVFVVIVRARILNAFDTIEINQPVKLIR
jgi:gliding motility-associated-like protein